MFDTLKNNLASIAALIAAIVAIGGGFTKYGEINTSMVKSTLDCLILKKEWEVIKKELLFKKILRQLQR